MRRSKAFGRACLSVCLSVCLCVCLSVCLPVCLCVCLLRALTCERLHLQTSLSVRWYVFSKVSSSRSSDQGQGQGQGHRSKKVSHTWLHQLKCNIIFTIFLKNSIYSSTIVSNNVRRSSSTTMHSSRLFLELALDSLRARVLGRYAMTFRSDHP